MWLVQRLCKDGGFKVPEYGQVTLNTGGITVSGSAEWRGIPFFSPYGFSCLPPQGKRALLVPCAGAAVCAGIAMEERLLEEGECCLYSSGGATVTLKKNGEAVINGVIIRPDGSIRAKSVITEEGNNGYQAV